MILLSTYLPGARVSASRVAVGLSWGALTMIHTHSGLQDLSSNAAELVAMGLSWIALVRALLFEAPRFPSVVHSKSLASGTLEP